MQSIGEKIEEARKRKGISLSEAAEATKIRSDFLYNIENNQYDYDLPDIYKRGFIKNYARYLKLNSDKILAQYQEQQITNSRRRKKDKANSDLFGNNLDINSANKDEVISDAFQNKPSFGKINLDKPKKGSVTDNTSSVPTETHPELSNKDLYIKSGIVGIATLLFVLLIIWLIQSIFQPDTNPSMALNTDQSSSALSAVKNSSQLSNEYAIREITIKATGIVYVIIRQKLDNKTLLSKKLIEGEVQTIKRQGPVEIAFTKGNLVQFIADDSTDPYIPVVDGHGRIVVP